MVDNKLILKNTILLYMRMFFLMAISLYTSRAILEVLGIDNYGIYNVVGSVIVLFSFISSALSSSTRRYLNFWLGRNNSVRLRQVFSTCFSIHLVISFIILLLGETIGLWMMNHTLNIPENRIQAANWVYQISVFSAVIGVLTVPFEAAIVAKEKLNIYAYISIGEAILKLLLVFLLYHSPIDILIYYAVLLFLISLLFLGFKVLYCLRKFDFCHPQIILKNKETRDIWKFTGWSLFGQIAYIGSTTGLNILINIFLGVTINAAVGIANQVNTIVYNFVSNFQTSFTPQLIQTYSSNNLVGHRVLISRASRISLYLLLLLVVPLIFNANFILNIWLVVVPEYAAPFLIAILLCSLVEAYGAPLWMSMQAIGKINVYQIMVSFINAMILPVSYILLYLGYSPVWIFITKVVIAVILYAYRVMYVLPKVGQSRIVFLSENIFKSAIIILFSFTVAWIISSCFSPSWIKLIVTTMSSTVLTLFLIYFIGLTQSEKMFVADKIKIFKLKFGFL